jgi:hypothetical protein
MEGAIKAWSAFVAKIAERVKRVLHGGRREEKEKKDREISLCLG